MSIPSQYFAGFKAREHARPFATELAEALGGSSHGVPSHLSHQFDGNSRNRSNSGSDGNFQQGQPATVALFRTFAALHLGQRRDRLGQGTSRGKYLDSCWWPIRSQKR